ncbi:hypothetical protein [Nostoc sp. CALU 546]|uniref:hypothetical protein n=1 Tax=Nostoc sp. CALU 546 TaxID=1867241 RepID=UPI003B671DEB
MYFSFCGERYILIRRSPSLPAGAIASSSVLTKLNKFKNLPLHLVLVESMGGIILRTSQLEPNVRLSPHSAPDILRQGNYSCVFAYPRK